jgi:hypothetical protein
MQTNSTKLEDRIVKSIKIKSTKGSHNTYRKHIHFVYEDMVADNMNESILMQLI